MHAVVKAVLLAADIAFSIFVFNLGETVAGVHGGFISIGLCWSFVIMFCLTDRLLETKLRRRRQRRAAMSLGLPWLKDLDPEFFITVLMSSELSKKQAKRFARNIDFPEPGSPPIRKHSSHNETVTISPSSSMPMGIRSQTERNSPGFPGHVSTPPSERGEPFIILRYTTEASR